MNTVPVSVVIPCFRCTATLERAVASVAVQTRLPQELILVDDGSGDDTPALMAELQRRYENGWIRLVHSSVNAGAANARNSGWEQARGEFVAFLDSDDAWHPRKIEVQYQFMSSAADVALSGHGHLQVDALPAHPADTGEALFQKVAPLYVLLKNPFVTPSFMVRRELALRFLAGRRHMEDHHFVMQVSAAGLGVARSALPLAYVFKPIYGASGLSADLMQMQRGELENYRLMGSAGHISTLTVALLNAYSWLKFLRRCLIVKRRKTWSRQGGGNC